MPMFLFRLFILLAALAFAKPAAAQDCTNPDGDLGIILYNQDHGVFQGCTAHGWAAFHRMTQPLGCPANGLVGHWKLNESGNVSTAADSAGSNDGALTNFPADPSANWVTGKLGNALEFDGTDDYVDIPHHADWNFAGKTRSIAFWFKTTGHNLDGVILEHHSGSQGWYIDVEENDGGLPGKLQMLHAGTDTVSLTSTAPLNDDQWHHAVFTLDGSTAKLYIDGDPDDDDAYSDLTDIASHGLYIGNMVGSSPIYTGSVDDVRIYNVALDATEVSALYNGGAGCQ